MTTEAAVAAARTMMTATGEESCNGLLRGAGYDSLFVAAGQGCAVLGHHRTD